MILGTNLLAEYVQRFNAADEETVRQHIPNATCLEWLAENVPLFECPDQVPQEIYYFRWWTFRKHIKKTPGGFIVTEFLPSVGWAGKYNSISCAAGHHIREGRWLKDASYLQDYVRFWFRGGGSLRAYSNWIGDALVRFCRTTGDFGLACDLLPELRANYEGWEAENLHESGLFWSEDGRDGGELSVSGSGLRPTLNAYLYGEARAISRIAREKGLPDIEERYAGKAARIKQLVQERLWDPKDRFFKVIPLGSRAERVRSWDFAAIEPSRNVRELHGYAPWYFGLPDPGFEAAWAELKNTNGFSGAYGLTTAEQRHPGFVLSNEGHECQWNGPSWPFATSVTLSALARLLGEYVQPYVGPSDYLAELLRYARASHRQLPDGRLVPWIDENINPATGDWIARTRLSQWRDSTWSAEKGGYERGKDYNHSTFCDLVISGLVGIEPPDGPSLTVRPLVPPGTWDYFCVDRVPYRGREITVLWDRTGQWYRRGPGLAVYVDGSEKARAAELGPLTIPA